MQHTSKEKRLISLPELELAYLQFAWTIVSYRRVCRQVWLFKQSTLSNSSSQQNLLHVLKQSLTPTQHLSSESAATLVYLLNRCMAQILIAITRDSRITRIPRHSCLLTPFWVVEFISLTQMLPYHNQHTFWMVVTLFHQNNPKHSSNSVPQKIHKNPNDHSYEKNCQLKLNNVSYIP